MCSVRVVLRSAAFVCAAFLTFIGSAYADCAFHSILKVGSTLPLRITKSGCYRLSADVVVPDGNTNGIRILANDVRLNLNGHGVIGPNTCSGTPAVCTIAAGTGIGIDAINTKNVVVRDGFVRGMGGHGIRLGTHSHVSNVSSSENGLAGIFGGLVNELENVLSEQNGGQGVVCGDDSSLKSSISPTTRSAGSTAETASNRPTW